MKFEILNEISLHFADEGPSDGIPIVFSNSLGTDFRIWDSMIAAINASNQNSFRFIRYDKRGHGLSDAPLSPYTIEDHTNDLIALLDHLDIENAVIIGLSVGGLITQSLVASAPEKVRAIVLMDTSHKIGNDELWTSRITDIRKNGIESITDNIMERWFSENFRQSRKSEFSAYRNMLVRTPLEGYLGTCAAIRDADLSDVAKKITKPALLLVGSNDGSTPPDVVENTHNLIVGSKFEIIDGPGHLPNIEKPEETAAFILKFFKENAIV